MSPALDPIVRQAGLPPRAGHMRGELLPLEDCAWLEAEWTALEAQADASPFTAWPWVSTWLRYLPPRVRPLLFRAREAGGTVALGLLVCAPQRGLGRLFGSHALHLHETGEPVLDEITAEYVGLLVRRGSEGNAYAALFETLQSGRGWRRLCIANTAHASAIAAALPRAMAATCVEARPCHYVDLAALRAQGRGYAAALGKKTRSGLRQAGRAYATLGPVRAELAREPDTALAWLGELERLHTRYWNAKGGSGAFASPFFGRFHSDLVARGTAGGFTRMVRVSAGAHVVGYLYALEWRNCVYFYNSGLRYGLLPRYDRPGVVALHAAIEQAAGEGRDAFDFLAGAQDYKRRLSTATRWLHRVEVRRAGLRAGLERLAAAVAGRPGFGQPLHEALSAPHFSLD